MKRFVLFYLLLLLVTESSAQGGCKDPAATNYNPSATYNNGSCTYSPISYTPPVKVDSIGSSLNETSGLQMAGNFLWSFNDGGSAAAIYRIDTTTGNILQTVNLQGAANIDWEDIGFDGTHFYVGDFGNNATGIRTDLKIYKFPLSAIPDYDANSIVTISAAQIEVINFAYSTQTDFSTAASNNTKYDCEAMIVDGGQIHLFTKNWVETNTIHYVINATNAGSYLATPVDTLPTGYLVTGADKVPNQNIAILIGYQTTGFYNHFMHLLTDFSGNQFFNGNKRKINLPNVFTMGQAEGICFVNGNYGYVSNERISSPFTITQKLRSFNLQSFVPVYVALPIHLVSFNVAHTDDLNKLSWTFSAPVKNLKLLTGENTVDFRTLVEYTSSTTGSFYHKPLGAANCYKLEWQLHNGNQKLSNTICITNEWKEFRNVRLQSSGEVSFISANNALRPYAIRLFSTDGRMIAQASINKIAKGYNQVRLGKPFAHHQLFIFQLVGPDKQLTRLLQTE